MSPLLKDVKHILVLSGICATFVMMKITFSKYQGTGNDFVMLDNMTGEYDTLSIKQIQFLCNRKLGVGADGLIKLSKKEGFDFEVEYFNADGSQSFCGNGARCSVAFAKAIGIIGDKTEFYAIDGGHKAFVIDNEVKLEMLDVDSFELNEKDYIIDTGSPHYVRLVNDIEAVNIIEFGRAVRYSETYQEDGINVNTLAITGECQIDVATYERGVEDETLSCGTGVTACALAYMKMNDIQEAKVDVSTKGGNLSVQAKVNEKGFNDIWLKGPATFVFNGAIDA
ncbi:MAG: diaminopimelate epimerase [Crocinitomicaceae bacterium]